MKLAPIFLLIGILVAGCQSGTPEASQKAESAASGSSATSDPGLSAKDSGKEGIKPGMNMADVKKIKGAPKDTKHDHGPNDSEIDLWIYEDQTVKFQNGKVVE